MHAIRGHCVGHCPWVVTLLMEGVRLGLRTKEGREKKAARYVISRREKRRREADAACSKAGKVQPEDVGEKLGKKVKFDANEEYEINSIVQHSDDYDDKITRFQVLWEPCFANDFDTKETSWHTEKSLRQKGAGALLDTYLATQ